MNIDLSVETRLLKDGKVISINSGSYFYINGKYTLKFNLMDNSIIINDKHYLIETITVSRLTENKNESNM